jgi:NAD(P)-dependent dehydrogenase (short-subunit alcohol dehydrogenase family)
MTGMRAVIFGATGGIGDALVAQLAATGSYSQIYAGGRSLPPVKHPVEIPFAFDLTDEASIARAAQSIGAAGPVDLAIVATGILHDHSAFTPEKSARALDADSLARVFAVNTIGPALISKHILPLMRRDARAVFAALSARVGSITDNRLGGWHSYRASKAALNMLFRNFAIEFAGRNRQGIVVTIHPGTVDTVLSRPFQRGVPQGRLLEPKQSAAHILSVLDSLSPQDSGGLFAWSGERIPF